MWPMFYFVVASFACLAFAGHSEARPVRTPPAAGKNAAIPDSDRVAIEFDLAWTGDYTALITGKAEDNEKVTADIKSFQKNRRLK